MISVSFVLQQPTAHASVLTAFATTTDMLVLDCGVTLHEARSFLTARSPRVAFIALRLGNDEGAALIAEMAERLPSLSIVALGTGAQEAIRALRSGAVGFLESAATPAEWLAAAREAYLGGAPLSRAIARPVVTALAHEHRIDGARPMLTARERDVLTELAGGATYRVVGAQLGIAEDTVRAHVRGLYRKLRVRTRSEALARYLELQAVAAPERQQRAC